MPKLNTLPNELQGLIISQLDTKSQAKLRTVSTEMRRAVDDVEPPTGSYERRSGRYQSFWTEKRRRKCHRKHDYIADDSYSKLGYGRARVNGFINHVFDECMRDYKRSSLLGIFKIMRTDTPEEFAPFFIQCYQWDPYTDKNALKFLHETLHEQKEFLRRVTRLIKQWGKTDKRYAETYHLIMRRKKLTTINDIDVFYTPYEERMHKDRIMDALLVQYIAAIVNIDVTKPGYTKSGRKRTLGEQIKYVTGRCRERTRDDSKPKKTVKNEKTGRNEKTGKKST